MSADPLAPAPVPPAPLAGPEAAPPRPPREHRHDIDLLRLICAVGVVMGHVGGDYLMSVDVDPGNGPATYWTGMVFDSFSHFAVPMYFAIAGWAVLVGAPPKDGRRLAQRLVRIVIPLFVWTAIYLAWGRLNGTNGGSAGEFAWQSLLGTIRPAYHLWYLYTYVPVVLFLGFVVLLKAGRRPWGIALALLGFAVAGKHTGDLAWFTGWELPTFAWGFGVYQVVYAAAGAMVLALHNRRLPRWVWPLVATAALGGVMWYQHAVHYVIPNSNLLTAGLMIGVALTVSRVRVPERVRPLLSSLGAAALGAYMIHVLVLRSLSDLVAHPGHGWLAAIGVAVALTVVTLAISFGASLLWGRLRLRRLLG
ncbi:acyltransferase family protein [Phytomonospora sp. NPDC050363]|uniref:acyltransferase n=1 Tax=Phytomonospora sp. NPDC050363 TaxID=3155642 RepID=UPI00340F72C4